VQSWVIAVSVPVILDDELRYILSMSLEPKHFQRILVTSVPADGWIVALSDKTGRLIARSQEHDAYVGREMHAESVRGAVARRASIAPQALPDLRSCVGTSGQRTLGGLRPPLFHRRSLTGLS
jgi:hypothetical protein